MGDFQKHEPCPNCGSRNNVGVWTDGKWCFGCGYRVPGYKGMSIEDIKKQIQYDEDKDSKRNRKPYLPEDFSLSIPDAPLGWLRKYGITDEERQHYRIGWTDEHQSLVFPAFDLWGNLLMVQLRGFPQKTFYTRGFPEAVLWTTNLSGRDTGSVCLVEDFVSAVRVGRNACASPLWGSGISLGQIRRIADRYERLSLWLDFDKAGVAARYRIKALPYFKSVSVIVTERDPKDYTDEQIKQNLGLVP